MSIQVTVVYSAAPRHVSEIQLTLADGSRVEAALRASGMLEAFPDLRLESAVVGVWGRKAALDQALRDHDRVEIYRPLKVDPKVARRERFAKQGARSAGLFARKRAGGKAGY